MLVAHVVQLAHALLGDFHFDVPTEALEPCDVAWFPWLPRAEAYLGIQLDAYPAVSAWLERLAERRSFEAYAERTFARDDFDPTLCAVAEADGIDEQVAALLVQMQAGMPRAEAVGGVGVEWVDGVEQPVIVHVRIARRALRAGGERQDLTGADAVVIQRGDVLHCDVGITALGLNTDTQHMGYVLREGERDAPPGLKRALLNSNQLQDILLAEMRPGRTGNEVLHSALGAMRAAGITGTIYTHPVGDRGHGAGPLIGLWDHQEGVPGRGDVPLLPATWFAIELQATTTVPEWGGQLVRSAQEEDAELGADGSVRWILRRQTAFHLVR